MNDFLEPVHHLTNEQFETLLLMSSESHPHLRSCELCATQLSALRSSIGDLRTASVAAAEHHYQAAVMAQTSRQRKAAQPRFVWTRFASAMTAAALLFIGLPFAAKFKMFKPAIAPVAIATAATRPAVSSNLSNVSDDQLLSNIQSDLSASVPSPLLPLESTSTATSTKETE